MHWHLVRLNRKLLHLANLQETQQDLPTNCPNFKEQAQHQSQQTQQLLSFVLKLVTAGCKNDPLLTSASHSVLLQPEDGAGANQNGKGTGMWPAPDLELESKVLHLH